MRISTDYSDGFEHKLRRESEREGYFSSSSIIMERISFYLNFIARNCQCCNDEDIPVSCEQQENQ